MTLVTCVILYVGKEYVNEPLRRRKFPLPVPFELIVVVVGTVLSYVLQLSAIHSVKVVGNIPAGYD